MNRLSKTNILITLFLLLSFVIQVKARYGNGAQSSQQINPQMNFRFNSQTYGGVPQLDDQGTVDERLQLHKRPAVEDDQK